jgi:AbrB family looped-hinge helix DNA binding protein
MYKHVVLVSLTDGNRRGSEPISMTGVYYCHAKLAQVRVKRKGQVTIPSELRLKLGIDEGALLEVQEQKER